MKVIWCTSSALWKRKNTKAEKQFSLGNEAPFLKERGTVRPQTLFAVGANQKIRRSVWAKAHRSARIQVGFSRPCNLCRLQEWNGISSFAKGKYALANIFQALKQTGGTTRDCRFCLQVHNFLLMEGWSAFYRKFLRISSIKDLWAMTRRH